MDDKLKIMFDTQYKLQEKLGTFDKIKNEKDRQEFINQMILACQEEVVEIMKETNYKNPEYVKFGWKKNQVFNELEYLEEIIDLWHFIMNLWIIKAGNTPEKFFEFYCKKNNINLDRQKNNY